MGSPAGRETPSCRVRGGRIILGGGWFPFGPEMVPLDLVGLSLLCSVIGRTDILWHARCQVPTHHPEPRALTAGWCGGC